MFDSTVSVPSVHDLYSDANVTTRGVYESAQAIQEIAEAHFAAMVLEDTSHCRDCGCITSGSQIGGSHVQLCDACIAQWAVDQLGVPLVKTILRAAMA